ncbi:MAG: efflux RND transporter periplasmic adaptor subunit [Bacteroidota bacterium]
MKQYSKIIALSLWAGVFISCGGEEKKEEKIVRPVSYQEVGFLGNEKVRTFSGTAQTDKIINLSFRSDGIITEFDIKLGQRVKKGQLLAKLDNVAARLNYENSVSSKNSAESEMNTAKLNLNRVRLLYEKGSSALSDFEAAKNAFKTAQQSFESAVRSVAIQQEQIRYGYVYAPENGVIASVNAEIDENISPGQTIAVLNAGVDMEISLGIPESIINNVKQDMLVSVSFSSILDQVFKGKVSEVSPSVDSNTATYPIRVIIVDPTEDVKSGMAANVTFDFGNGNGNYNDTQRILIVPAKAVGEDSEGNFVYIIESEDGKLGVAKRQAVTIGGLTSAGFEIKNGLAAGQKIATAGLQTLLNGQQVRLQ